MLKKSGKQALKSCTINKKCVCCIFLVFGLLFGVVWLLQYLQDEVIHHCVEILRDFSTDIPVAYFTDKPYIKANPWNEITTAVVAMDDLILPSYVEETISMNVSI